MAVLLCLRRTHPCLLHHHRLLSTSCGGDGPNPFLSFPFSNSKHNEQFEKQLTVSLLRSLRDRYAVDGLLLSEMIKSRQAFLNETINNLSLLSALPSYPTLLPPPPQQKIILFEKLENLNRLDRLMSLKDVLVEEDEMSANLSNSRLTFLQEIINNFSETRRRASLDERRRKKLNERLMRLREMEMEFNSFPMKIFCEQLETGNMVMRLELMMMKKEDEWSAAMSNAGLTSLQVKEILGNSILEICRQTSVPPPLDDYEGWRKKWNELNERLTRLRREMLVKENELSVRFTIHGNICEWLKTVNRCLRLKEMLVKEDELSAELTNSRLTSLQEIISEIRPRKKWDELNERLMRLREMEVEDAELLAVRKNVNGELDNSVSQRVKNLFVFHRQTG